MRISNILLLFSLLWTKMTLFKYHLSFPIRDRERLPLPRLSDTLEESLEPELHSRIPLLHSWWYSSTETVQLYPLHLGNSHEWMWVEVRGGGPRVDGKWTSVESPLVNGKEAERKRVLLLRSFSSSPTTVVSICSWESGTFCLWF